MGDAWAVHVAHPCAFLMVSVMAFSFQTLFVYMYEFGHSVFACKQLLNCT